MSNSNFHMPPPPDLDASDRMLDDMGLIHPTNEDVVALDHNAHMTDTFIDEDWTPPSNLPTPPPREGYVQRWINVGYGDEAISNIRKKQKEGWVPRNINTLPAQDIVPLIQDEQRYPESIIEGDLCLMEMSARRNESRKAHHEAKTAAVTAAIDHDLNRASKEGGIPIHKDSRSQTSTGSGRVPNVGND